MSLHWMRLGKFAQDQSGALYGRISGLGIGSTTVMSQEAQSKDGKSYLKLFAEAGNASYEVGAAFIREKEGVTYYSTILESPLFMAPINAVLYPDRENQGMFDLIWDRSEAFGYSADLTSANGRSAARRFIGSAAAP